MTALCIQLPYPPSVNHYWRWVMIGKMPRVLISKGGREYRAQVASQALTLPVLKGWQCPDQVAVSFLAYPPDRRMRDIDNLGKALLDALVYAGILPADSQKVVRKLVLEWGTPAESGLVETEITPYEL